MFGHADFTLAPSLYSYPAACIRRIALSCIRWPSFVTESDEALDISRDISQAFGVKKNSLLGPGTSDRSSDNNKSRITFF